MRKASVYEVTANYIVNLFNIVPVKTYLYRNLMLNIIDPYIQKQAIEDALKDESCPDHHLRVKAVIKDGKLQLHYCCKLFAAKVAPMLSKVNEALLIRYRKGDM